MLAHQVNQTKQAKQTHQPTRPTRTIQCNRPTRPTRTIKPAVEIFSYFHNSKFTPPKAAPNCARLGAVCHVILYILGPSPAYPVLRYIWMAFYKNRCRNKLVSQIHTSFPYNTQLLPQSNDLLPRLDLEYPIVNQDDFFGCFQLLLQC